MDLSDAGAGVDGGPSFEGPAPALASSPGYAAPPQLAFQVFAGRGGLAPIAANDMLASLFAADAVCLGETHDSFAAHSLQLLIVDRLRRGATDPQLAVGMEMFQRPFQAALDDFSQARIDEGTLRTVSEYDVRWGYDWDLYRPLVLHAVAHAHPLLALNAARELTRRVSDVGIAGLTAEEQAQLPELDFTNAAHREWFQAQVANIPGHDPARLDRMYTTQVIWDETMAQTSAQWVQAAPGRRVAIIAGRGHCVDGAIPTRMQRRGVRNVQALQIIDDEPGALQAASATQPADFLVTVSMP